MPKPKLDRLPLNTTVSGPVMRRLRKHIDQLQLPLNIAVAQALTEWLDRKEKEKKND